MQDKAMSTIKDSAPWRRGVAWPIIAIEGLILLVIGIFIFADKESAADVIRQLIAAILLVNGLLEILAGFRNQGAVGSPYRILRGGVGATIGVLVLLENVSDYLDGDSSRVILAWGLIAFGVIGLAASLLARSEAGLRISALVTGVLTIILGVILLTGGADSTSRMNLLGTIALVFGVLLLGYAYLLYRGNQQTSAQAGAVAQTGGSGGASAPSGPSNQANGGNSPADSGSTGNRGSGGAAS